MERRNYQRDYANRRLEWKQPEENLPDIVESIVADFCRPVQEKGKPKHQDLIFLRLYMATNDK